VRVDERQEFRNGHHYWNLIELVQSLIMKLEGFSCYIGRVEIKVKPKSERVEAYYQERFLEFRSRAQNRGVMVEFGCSGVFFFIRFHLGLL